MTTGSPRQVSPEEFEKLVSLAQGHDVARRFAESEAAYRKMIEIRPDLAEAHNNLGNALKDLGRLEEAKAAYQQAVTLKPSLLPAHNNLGNIFKAQGQLEQATASYERALAQNPNLAELHGNLAVVLRDRGLLQRAAAHYERALALKPNYVEALYRLANLLREVGQLDRAAVLYRRALDLVPNFPDAHNNLGITLSDQGRLDDAVAHFERALALKPDLVRAHNNLGNVFKVQSKFDQAAVHYQQALALKPDYVLAIENLADVRASQGQLDQARALYEQLLTLQPDYVKVINALANVFTGLGQFDQAAAAYDRALALEPDHAEAHHGRARMKTFRPGDAELAALEALAADSGRLPSSKMRHIHFALGKALEDIGEFDRAFEQWLKANALIRQDIDYDEAADEQFFHQIVERFDSGLFDRFQTAGDPSSVPIFILGMPRSGSTLVEQILASHPQVLGAGELPGLHIVANSTLGSDNRPAPFPACVSTFGVHDFRRLGRAYLDTLVPLPDGKSRLTDKAPTNFVYVGLIRLMLPNAKIIHTMRDPIDTCLSCFSKYFTTAIKFSCDLGELGRFYRRYTELMDHWRKVLPTGSMLDVGYENVVDNLEEQARRLIDFCGLPWDDRCLSFHKTKRPVTTASCVQVRQPLYRSSLERWRRYEAHLGPLLVELPKRSTAQSSEVPPPDVSPPERLADDQPPQSQLEQVVTRCEAALVLRPDDPDALNDLGNALSDQDRLDAAVTSYRRALAIRPEFAAAHNNLATALRAQGHLDEARAELDEALRIKPDYAEAHFNRADLKTFRPGDNDLEALESLAAAASPLPDGKRLYVHFALAKALDDLGEYDRAFEHLLQGNSLKRREVNYFEPGYEQKFQEIVKAFDAKLFERWANAGDPSSVPIFVVGLPRSGTTLVEQILASHPQVYGGGELKNLHRIANSVPGPDGQTVHYPACVSLLDADILRRLGEEYLASLPSVPEAKNRITDKTPSKFAYVGLIRLILPNAKIIHAMRDPVDTCLSCFSKLFSSGQEFTYDLGELGRYCRRYLELMEHWRSVLPAGAMLDVAYEDIVEDLPRQVRRLTDYCGLPWDDRCLSFHETERPISTASNVQVRKPLYRTSLGRWRRYEAHLGPLLSELSGHLKPR
jgi:tetratricopeptide (TPR) repeat protein